MKIPVTNPRGYRECIRCKQNDGVFESEKCLDCFNNPLLSDNFELKKGTESA